MPLLSILTSFQGRVGRLAFWLTQIPILIVGLVVAFIALHLLSNGEWVDPQYGADMGGTRALALSALVGIAATLYPYLAVTVKRLHDRGRSGWFATYFLAPSVASAGADMLGLGGTAMERNWLGFGLELASIAVLIWFLVELGFLPGAPGRNEYGPSPAVAEEAATSIQD